MARLAPADRADVMGNHAKSPKQKPKNKRTKTMIYAMGKLTLDQFAVNPKFQNNPGLIWIGGDKGDVWANRAYQADTDIAENGVELINAELITNIPNLTYDEVYDMIVEIISNSYDSIQEETFNPQLKAENHYPNDQRIILNN